MSQDAMNPLAVWLSRFVSGGCGQTFRPRRPLCGHPGQLSELSGTLIDMRRECKIDYCDKPSRALGMCRSHYRAHKLYGDADEWTDRRERRTALCNRPNCRRHAESLGLCDTHYQRVRRGTEPLELPATTDPRSYLDGTTRRGRAIRLSKPVPTGYGDGVHPGLSGRAIAVELGVSERTVRRWLAAERA